MCNSIKSVLFAIIDLNCKKRSMTKVPFSQYGNTTDFRNWLNFSKTDSIQKFTVKTDYITTATELNTIHIRRTEGDTL